MPKIDNMRMCVPARDMKRIEGSKTNIIDALDLEQLNGKVIMKLLYSMYQGKCELGVDPADTALLTKQLKDSWREIAADRGWDRMIKAQLEVAAWPGMGSTTALSNLIMNHVRKQGGFLKYWEKDFKYRPDAVGCVRYEPNLKEHQTYPCGVVSHAAPLKICQCCGALNIFSHFDGKKTLGRKAILDLTFQDEWRCGMCWGDLNMTVDNNLISCMTATIDLIQEFVDRLGTNLDELLTQGYGDVYDNIGTTAQTTIAGHDRVLVNKYFSDISRTEVLVGCNE
jgi:hypothetical protein